jgi:thiol-disulfide isomerase/thioredoxin
MVLCLGVAISYLRAQEAAVAEAPDEEAAEVAEAAEIDPAALELLTKSAEFISKAAGAQVDLKFSLHVKADDQEQSEEQTYTLKRTADGKFSLAPEVVEEGIVITSDGAETFTYVAGQKMYTLAPQASSLVDFVKSPLSRFLHNGLGRIALGLFDPQTTADMVQDATAAEIVGDDKIGDQAATHARYVVNGMTIDMWFAQGDQPVVLKLVPDMGSAMAERVAAQGIKDFRYDAAYEFANWNTTEPLAKDAFLIEEPEGAELVESFFDQAEEPHPLLGQPAPEFTLVNLDGEETPIAKSLGKEVIVLDFWATWCGPCVMALPVLIEVTGGFAEQGVKFYAVNQQEDAETVKTFLADKGLTPPVLLDTEGEVGGKYSVEGLPTSIIIGKDGRVQVVHVGFGGNLKKKLTAELTSLVAGEDLAAAAIAEREAAEAKKAAAKAGVKARNEARRAKLG